MEPAAFKLADYNFSKTIIDYSNHGEGDIDIDFKVNGQYKRSDSKFYLNFETIGKVEGYEDTFISVQCQGIFEFKNVDSFSEIPNFFYVNCIAILFPYVRSYISTVSVQSNIKPIILPTLNLTPLAQELRESSQEID